MHFIIQTPHPWAGIRQRCHHLAVRFALAGHEVDWIETRYMSWLARRPADFWRPRREEPHEALHVRAVTLANGERLEPVRALNKRRLGGIVPRRAAAGPRVLWLYNPHEAHLADRVAHDLLIYDIMDEYRGFPWSPPRIVEEEAELLRRADWVFAGTHALYESKGPAAEGRIECVLSGVDTEHFAEPSPEAVLAVAADEAFNAARRAHPHLMGYAGAVDLRIDAELLGAMAQRHPEWGFMLIGPVSADLTALAARPNVYLPGPREYFHLPAYYQACDVLMLPFVENQLTRHINPTKMLEYAAAGRPIVARALPDVRRCYADGAWLYADAAGFAEHLERLSRPAHAQVEDKLLAARRWADERSWDALARRMLQRVERLLDRTAHTRDATPTTAP